MIRRETFSISQRHVVPHDFENRGPVRMDREAPAVELEPLKGIACKVSRNGHANPRSTQVEQTKIEYFGTFRPALKLTPLGKKPLLKVFSVSFGGGRIYGGGLSKEAIRRAKKKQSGK